MTPELSKAEKRTPGSAERLSPLRWFARWCAAAFAGIAIAASLGVTPAAAQEDEAILERWRYFYEMRAYPFERVPAGALQRAFRQTLQRWPDVIARDRISDINASTTAWTGIGPAPIAGGTVGRISSVAVHPTDPATMYIGAAQGGVWKTVNGGASWSPLTDAQCSLAMGAVTLDPVDPRIIYAGTGELHFSGDSYYGCGVLRSTDGGASWTQLGASVFDTNVGGARIGRIVVDPTSAGSTTGSLVYAATSSGFFRSTNSGVTWSMTLPGIATDLAVDPIDPRTVYAAIGSPNGGQTNGIFKSTDRGLTWARLTTGLPADNFGRIVLALAPSSPNTIYAAMQDAFGGAGADGQLLGIWKTIDAGATWVKQTATGADCGSQCWYDLFIATDPLDATVVYFGGILLYRSDDGGGRFTNITRSIHVDQHAIAFHPTNPATVFIGNDGGIFRTQNRGNSWVSLNTNLAITQFYPGIASHPIDPNVILGGTQDNGTLQFGGTDTWDTALGGDGGYTAIDYLDPTRAWAETQWTPNSGFSGPRIRLGAAGFGAPRVTGIDLSDRALFIPPLVMDPINPDVLYFGTFRLYRTVNSGNLWQPITGDLSDGIGRISSIAPAAADPTVIYVGTNDGKVHVSRDNGVTFELRTNGLPNRAFTDIAVDGRDAAVAVASVSGFGTGHVFRTTDFGVSWSDISGTLPDVPVSAVLTQPGLGDDIYIGTDLGVFRSMDSGANWEPFNPGLPNVAVFDLIYNGLTGLAIAATHGRGMFAFRPAIAAALVIAQETVDFVALQDSVRLTATAFDSTGAPIPGTPFLWRSLDPTVATVDPTGLVTARSNGQTGIIAAFAGVADTTIVRVSQVVVAVVGLPDSLTLVVGERVVTSVRAIDSHGQTAEGTIISLASANPTVAVVDAGLGITGASIGTTVVRATAGAFGDSTVVRVAPASITTVTASAVPADSTVRSAAGTRLPLLILDFAAAGIEPVEITRIGLDVTGNDPGATLLLIHDVDRNGQPGAAEPVLASFPVNLVEGETRQTTLSPGGALVPGGGQLRIIVAIGLSGRSPNGATFSATFQPQLTSSIGSRSGRKDLLVLPSSPIASAEIATTLLHAAALLTFSENPVRSARVIFNFAEVPSAAAVFTLTGRRVADLTRRVSDGGRVEWDLTNDDGNPVAPGVYLVIFNIRGEVMRERILILRPGDDGAIRNQETGRS